MEKEDVRRALKGRRAPVLAAQAGEVLVILTLTGAAFVGTGYISLLAGRYTLPFQMIYIVFIALCDLVLISPLKIHKYLTLRRCVTNEAIIYHNIGKMAVILRLKLWGRRVGCVAILGLLPAWLCALSFQGAAELLRDVTAAAFLVCSCVCTEVYMLQFGPAWQLLPACSTAKEAIKKSRRLMRGHWGEYLWTCFGMGGWGVGCLFLLPAIYTAPLMGVSRAMWIQRRSRSFE